MPDKIKKQIEERMYAFDIQTRTDEKHGNVLEGTPIVFDQPTDYGGWWKEIIEKGALDNTDMKDVRFLVNHDTERYFKQEKNQMDQEIYWYIREHFHLVDSIENFDVYIYNKE